MVLKVIILCLDLPNSSPPHHKSCSYTFFFYFSFLFQKNLEVTLDSSNFWGTVSVAELEGGALGNQGGRWIFFLGDFLGNQGRRWVGASVLGVAFWGLMNEDQNMSCTGEPEGHADRPNIGLFFGLGWC